jgi:hypothetical protein
VLEHAADLVFGWDVDADLQRSLVTLRDPCPSAVVACLFADDVAATRPLAIASAMIDPRLDTTLSANTRDRPLRITTVLKLCTEAGVSSASLM